MTVAASSPFTIMTARLRIVRRNGNLVSRLIGDLRNPRNAVRNPVHRQRVNFASRQQEAARVTTEIRFVCGRGSIRESAHELNPDRFAFFRVCAREQNGIRFKNSDSHRLSACAERKNIFLESCVGQSNRLDTDSSEAVRPMASAIREATESTRMLAALRTTSVG